VLIDRIELKCSYAKSGYWQMNFDDFPNAMLSLFALVIVNNWQNIMDGELFSGVATSLARVLNFVVNL
jgi:hypothetical protein